MPPAPHPDTDPDDDPGHDVDAGPVAVVGDGSVVDAVTDAAARHDRSVLSASPGGVPDWRTPPALLVAHGAAGLATVLATGPTAPVLPVGLPETAGPAVGETGAAVTAALDGRVPIRRRPVLRVTAGADTVRGLLDATLMTTEPARISEYAVHDGQGRAVTHLRADGLTVATPLGSAGYGARSGGPIVGPGVDGLAVVPVSPFAVARRTHVVSDPVRVTVERDEGSVDLQVDGRTVGRVGPSTPVTVATPDAVDVLSADEKT